MSVFSTAASKVVNLLGITAKGQATMANSLPVALASDQGILGVTAKGQATMANSLPVVIASDQQLTTTTGAKNALVFSYYRDPGEPPYPLDPFPLPTTATPNRTSVTIQNVHASANLYISTDDEVAVLSGYKVIPGASVTLQASATTVIYGISDAVNNLADVRIIEAV
jgi:hypothetical protein